MEKVKFNVSSKTARLIGRENISDSNGAIIELVKNAYDADAENAYIQFDIPYEDIPNEINISVLKNNFTETEISIIKTGYELNDNKYIKKKKLSEEELEKLKDIFFSKNKIIIVDNGTGMDEDIIKNVWMNIGTDDKEINVYSKKGRIKTGAKGIGKLSLQTEVYTKKENKPTVYWSIDWTQFDKVKLLDEINAEVQIKKENFKEILQEILKDNYKYVENYDAEHGTIIILKQTRETWNEKIFSRINNNLNSINPFGNTDKFNILLRNLVRPDLNFKTNDIFMSKEHYDYRIKAEFDGNEKIKMYMERNEIDLNAKQQKKVINDKEYTFDIQEFWKRKAFSQKNYQKEDYDKVIEYDINVKDLIENESEDQIKKVGKFSFELYFLKSGKSEYSIIKDIKVNKRKELLKKFSGIKLYRDNFKVRPYGEDGPMYDWLGLGKRAQLSPAGVTHPTGFWRVEPYQLIGNINISRNDNKNLTDMANRESLALNETYYLFVEIIQKIISKFEYDRQYVYREYGNWLKLKTDRISKSYQVIKDVVKEKENKSYHPGRCANFKVGNDIIATIGEVHPEVLENYDITRRVYLAELNITKVTKYARNNKKYVEIPKFPAVERDIAVIIDEEIEVGQIEKIITKKAKKLLESMNLFDIYRDEKIGHNKKSVAYALRFRDKNKTLQDEEINKIMETIISELEKQLGAELRR